MALRAGYERAVAATVVFDVLGTLFSLERLRPPLRALGAPDAALELWFAQSLRDYFACSHAGGYVPIAQVLEASLARSLAPFGAETPNSAAPMKPSHTRRFRSKEVAFRTQYRLHDPFASFSRAFFPSFA